MNKEKLMQLFSDALDKGASFHIHVPQYDFSDGTKKRSKSEAESFMQLATEALDGGQVKSSTDEVCDSITLVKDRMRVVFSHFSYMEEDVLLGGDTDGTPLGTSDDRAC